MKLEFSKQIFQKHSYTNFYENPSSVSMRTDGQKYLTKLIFFIPEFYEHA